MGASCAAPSPAGIPPSVPPELLPLEEPLLLPLDEPLPLPLDEPDPPSHSHSPSCPLESHGA